MPWSITKNVKDLREGDEIILNAATTLTLTKDPQIIRQGSKPGPCPYMVFTDRFPQGTRAQADARFRVVCSRGEAEEAAELLEEARLLAEDEKKHKKQYRP